MTTSSKQKYNQNMLQLSSPITLEGIVSTFKKCRTASVKTLYCCGIDITPRVWNLFYTLESLKKLKLDQCRFAPEIYLNFPQLKKLKLQFLRNDFLNLLNLRISLPNMTKKLMFENKPLFRLL
jgi:hypothetical protein